MKTMFKVMAERADYEGRYTHYDLAIGMANTLEQAHEMAEAKVREYNPTHETGKYQVTECTMDEATFTYTEKVVFKGYTEAVKVVMREREITTCNRCIARYKNEIKLLNEKIAKRIAQGKEPAKAWIKDIEYYEKALIKEQEILNNIK